MRKNVLYSVWSALIATSLVLLTVSCSSEGKEETFEELTSENSSFTTTDGTCSSVVDFDDLEVETSWYLSDPSNPRSTYTACEVDDEDWMDKSSEGYFSLYCQSADGHRTELKELDGDESSLSTSKTMSFTAEYSNIPENGVTIAQIHNRATNNEGDLVINRPWIRVFIDDDNFFKIIETTNDPSNSSGEWTTHEYNRDDTTDTSFLYTSGESVDISIVTGSAVATITISYGDTTWTETIDPTSSWDDYSDDYYLKSGVYTEGNDTVAKVTYTSFTISH